VVSQRPRSHAGTRRTELATLASTETLLGRQPHHELSVERILSHAGVSRGTFYQYFSSKYDRMPGTVDSTRLAAGCFWTMERGWYEASGGAGHLARLPRVYDAVAETVVAVVLGS